MRIHNFAHIVPLELSEFSDTINDMHLLLYHWAVESEQYTKIFSRIKSYKIFDNSFYELKEPPKDFTHYIKFAGKINADEIVAPDIMYDFKKTKKLVDEFCSVAPKNIKIQAVVCGRTLKDYKQCIDFLNEHEDINVIAFSRNGSDKIDESKNSRFNTIKKLIVFEGKNWIKKPVHLLGAKSIMDYFQNYPIPIRSIDTKLIYKLCAGVKKLGFHNKTNTQIEKSMNRFSKYIKEVTK